MRGKRKGDPIPEGKKSWWKRKTRWGKVRFVIGMIALAFIGACGVFYFMMSSSDAKRRAALTQADDNGKPLNSVTYQGKTYVPDPDVRTVLFLGVDSKSAISEAYMVPSQFGQADVILVAAINDTAGTMKVINVPRDSMVDVKVYDKNGYYIGNYNEQLCLQYAFGTNNETCISLMEETIAEQVLKGVHFDNCVAINYGAIPTIVDDVGGVTITMSSDWTVGDTTYQAGDEVTFDGPEAGAFIRWRDTWEDGSNMTRITRQKDFLAALYAKAKEQIKKKPTLVASVYGDITKHLNTDLSVTDATSLAMSVLGADFNVEDNIVILPGEISEGLGPDNILHEQYILDMDAAKEIVLETFYKEWEDESDE